MTTEIRRQALSTFVARIQEPRRFLQVVAGPRQVGKTTLVQQALKQLPGHIAQHSVSADNPGLVGPSWLRTQWETARHLASQAGSCVLVLDEVQKLPHWTEEVKRLLNQGGFTHLPWPCYDLQKAAWLLEACEKCGECLAAYFGGHLNYSIG